MKTIYALDWYTSKYMKVWNVSEGVFEKLKAGQKIVYRSEWDGSKYSSVWVYLWYTLKTDRAATFERSLEGKELEYFDEQQEFALKQYPIFKKSFKEKFEGSRPVTGRYHIFGYQLYFYFYAEERYVFSDYVRWLREQVWGNIFLFQVWARDMVRMSPCAKEYLTINGRISHAAMTWPLPSVSMDNITIQGLDGRDVERLKWWSGRLKESMIYESELYVEESKEFPARWSKVKSKQWNITWVCLSFNIMTRNVTLKTNESEIYRLPVEQLVFQKKAVYDKEREKREE